jgi:glycosyltransferase involved in cell wall biosynthesis
MLWALSKLAEAHPRLRYVVVGDGDDRPRLERIVRELGLTERVMFIGARNSIEQVLPAADVFVLPTLMEALPTVLAEAAGMGLPIVASRVGGVAEMVDDGNSGFLVPPADPEALSQGCGKLLADPDLRRSMGGRARRLAEEWFDLERQVGRLAQLYRQVISGTGAGGCA